MHKWGLLKLVLMTIKLCTGKLISYPDFILIRSPQFFKIGAPFYSCVNHSSCFIGLTQARLGSPLVKLSGLKCECPKLIVSCYILSNVSRMTWCIQACANSFQFHLLPEGGVVLQ